MHTRKRSPTRTNARTHTLTHTLAHNSKQTKHNSHKGRDEGSGADTAG